MSSVYKSAYTDLNSSVSFGGGGGGGGSSRGRLDRRNNRPAPRTYGNGDGDPFDEIAAGFGVVAAGSAVVAAYAPPSPIKAGASSCSRIKWYSSYSGVY